MWSRGAFSAATLTIVLWVSYHYQEAGDPVNWVNGDILTNLIVARIVFYNNLVDTWQYREFVY